MSRFRWPLLVLLICLPVAILATGIPIPFLDRTITGDKPAAVPNDDREIAWLHTTTNFPTWERFVAGVMHAQALVPNLHVDDTRAFPDHTTRVPELVLTYAGQPGAVRIRWYKLSSATPTDTWVQALSRRNPAPVAIIGGGSSDRAKELAEAMNRTREWKGQRPLLFLTTATADQVLTEAGPSMDAFEANRELVDVYDDRTFRFCFTNRQMAEAVVDFTLSRDNLKPLANPNGPPRAFSVMWMDDPFSTDLHYRFGDALKSKARLETIKVPFSIGGFSEPNFHERKAAEEIVRLLKEQPTQRSLLILPTVTQPGRRLLRTLVELDPGVSRKLVAVTGDGIPVNALYRDGEFAWPVASIPVPLVVFTHNNPVGWDREKPASPPGYELLRPNSTEEVLHFAEMTRVLANAAFRPQLTIDADELSARLFAEPFFDANGNRRGGTGEHIVQVVPGDVVRLEIWKRDGNRVWVNIDTVPLTRRTGHPE